MKWIYLFRLVRYLPPSLVYACGVHIASLAHIRTKQEQIDIDEALAVYELEHKLEVK